MNLVNKKAFQYFLFVVPALGTILSIFSALGLLPSLLPFLYVNGVLALPFEFQIALTLCCAIYLLVVIVTVLGKKHTHKLKMEKHRYYRFFRKWYANPGAITMYCESLAWIKASSALMETLKAKCNDGLTLYLCDIGSPEVEALMKKGAKVYLLPRGNLKEFSFSIRNYHNSESFMIRYKDEDDHVNNTITVHEIYKDASRSVLIKYREELHRKVVGTVREPIEPIPT